MNMSFSVDCVRNYLITHGFVYTVRAEKFKYPTRVKVAGIGEYKVTIIAVIIEEADLLPRVVERSGFGSREEWWAAIQSFKAVPGTLWLVERID